MIWWLENKKSYIFYKFLKHLAFILIWWQTDLWTNYHMEKLGKLTLSQFAHCAVCTNIGAKIFCHFHCFLSTFISSPIFPWMVFIVHWPLMTFEWNFPKTCIRMSVHICFCMYVYFRFVVRFSNSWVLAVLCGGHNLPPYETITICTVCFFILILSHSFLI